MALFSKPAVAFDAGGSLDYEAPCFSYLGLEPLQIRLLKVFPGEPGEKLLCELYHTLLETAPSYSALSYAWGNNPQNKRISVKSDGSTWGDLTITPNLLSALNRLRDSLKIQWLWVDQLCIAQHDDSEKGEQVSLMKDIYAQAEKVVVWIGEDDSDTPLLQAMCARLSPKASQAGDISQMHLEDQLALKYMVNLTNSEAGSAKQSRDAVIDCLNRAWFRRAWVYQEAIVAAEVEVYCGYFCVSFDILARLVLSVYFLMKIEKDGLWSRCMKKSKGFGPLRALWYDRELYHQNKRLDFLHVLWRARKYLEATKPEDMVYSFLAFDDSSSEYRVKADYTIHSAETFRNLACSMIKSKGSLDTSMCCEY